MSKEAQQSHKILVVDDDPNVLSTFKSLLEFDGHEVQTVDGGEAALALLEQGVFDLIITDYAMPGMNGDEFAAHVKARWPQQPIILSSGSYAKSTVVSNGVLRVDYFLCKPVSMDELRDAIDWVVTHRAEIAQGLPRASWIIGGQLRQSGHHRTWSG